MNLYVYHDSFTDGLELWLSAKCTLQKMLWFKWSPITFHVLG
jgi:hypothetical protein